MDLFRQQFSVCRQLIQFIIQNLFPFWHRDLTAQPQINRILRIRNLCPFFPLLFKSPFLRLYRMHFLFQKSSAGRILSGDRCLLVFHRLLDPAEFFLLFLIFPLFAACLFLQSLKAVPALLHICAVRYPRHCPARLRFPHGLFQMDHRICRPFHQIFVMRDIQDRKTRLADERFHPFQSFQIDIIGRFIQQQNIRAFHQYARQLKLHLFPS